MLTETVSYTPQVGDSFHRPGRTATGRDGKPFWVPERRALVTMLNHAHVVCLIDSKEHTMPRGDFINLAEKTLANGSTLTRAT